MKKLIFTLSIVLTISSYAFSLDTPVFMAEANTGYAIGVNAASSMQFDIRLIYPLNKFGFIAEAGSTISDINSTHLFIGPAFFFINNAQWNMPLALGFEYYHGETLFYGIGASLSVRRNLTNNFYAGLNLGITYAFNNVYDELTGYRTSREVVDDGTSNAVFINRTVPIFEKKDHYGSYLYFKPSLLIGLQY